MKTIKTIIIGILLFVGIILFFGECDTFSDTLLVKTLAIADVILITYLWQWFGMEKYYENFLDKD